MANDKSKTKAQLIAELEETRQQRSVEKAAERIREEVLAMRRSEDMVKVMAVMWQEMVNLVEPGRNTPSFYAFRGRPAYVHLNGLAMV